MSKDFEYKEVEVGLPVERALDVAAFVANLVPLIGGPVSGLLSGMSSGRKEERILEVVQGVSDDLRDFKSETAEAYVKTEDFEELLESTLRRVAEERNAEKRKLYRRILTSAIKHPGGDYNEQIRFVKLLGELDPSHIIILRALKQQPEPNLGLIGSPMATLRSRAPEFTEEQIELLVNTLNDQRITSMASLRAMMTPHGATNLQHAITPFGQKFLSYIEAS